MKNQIIGKLGEEIACKYLLNRDYKILERNYKKSYYEADIIASKNDILAIVEVKTRKNDIYISANESVNFKKKSNLIKLANLYIYEKNIYNKNIRFDIIECYWETKKINHIINAFEV